MSRFVRAVLAFAVASLMGCAVTVHRPSAKGAALNVPPAATKRIVLLVQGAPTLAQSADWAAFQAEWRTAMASATSSHNVTFALHDAGVPEQSDPGTLVRVTVHSYRYVSAGARYGFGVMTGNAHMNIEVEFLELPSKTLLGTRRFNTSSSAWEGVFSAMTDKQVQAISIEIVKELTQTQTQ